ncbi:MAG: AarF/ABC1/UbiB kinase family protein [Anaerolineae bacterium]|nr:AarF/ABC1/UbiB kinase family protein [Anaerolineae bacterium]
MTEASPNRPQLDERDYHVDRRRYRKVMTFFAGIALNVIWREVIIRYLLGRRFAGRGRDRRLQRYATRFRTLAIDMGGVMIKLGQFISARVDVMPEAITSELAGLQDEVPPEDTADIIKVIEDELGAPLGETFSEFSRDTQAAASLGQVHRGQLKSGEMVAVKVLRPGIETVVATDLKALAVVARWTMYWKVIRKRADVPALMDEFGRTLWEEVDYIKEAENAKRFAELFADDPRVYVPDIYDAYSTQRVLTMEDVTSIKIADHEAIDAAGIDRSEVAYRLFDLYLQMIFIFGFFHADPHPGNLFVHPLGESTDSAEGGVPYYLVFVDFGMVGRITPQVKAGLREALIAAGTRDSARIIKSYQMLGILLPGADLERIEEAESEMLDFIWGKSVPELAQMKHSDMLAMTGKYRDLLYELPFQVPQDFIYLGRAIGILSGMCIQLDAEFNPWAQIAEYAQKLVADEATEQLESWVQEAIRLTQTAISIPTQLKDVLGRFQHGNVEIRLRTSDDLERGIGTIVSTLNSVVRAVFFASFLAAGTYLYVNGYTVPGIVGWSLAGIAWLTVVFRKRKP